MGAMLVVTFCLGCTQPSVISFKLNSWVACVAAARVYASNKGSASYCTDLNDGVTIPIKSDETKLSPVWQQ